MQSNKDQAQYKVSRIKNGSKFFSNDNKFILQARSNRFTLSHLGPYDGWPLFFQKGKYLWNIFSKKFNPKKVLRVAVRYINKIDIPATNVELEKYFYTYPKVLTQVKTEINNFAFQVHIPQTEGGIAILNPRMTSPPEAGYTSIILDIDVYDLKEFEANDSKLWKRIELLREQKNYLFENSITDLTKRLFSI